METGMECYPDNHLQFLHKPKRWLRCYRCLIFGGQSRNLGTRIRSELCRRFVEAPTTQEIALLAFGQILRWACTVLLTTPSVTFARTVPKVDGQLRLIFTTFTYCSQQLINSPLSAAGPEKARQQY